MALSDDDKLRLLLGEVIPAAGADTDTMFTTDQIAEFLTASTMNAAALEGWKAKAAHYSNLVTVTEGNSGRLMSDLYKAAMKMVEYYQELVDAELADTTADGKKGRVVIGVISRGRA